MWSLMGPVFPPYMVFRALALFAECKSNSLVTSCACAAIVMNLYAVDPDDLKYPCTEKRVNDEVRRVCQELDFDLYAYPSHLEALNAKFECKNDWPYREELCKLIRMNCGDHKLASSLISDITETTPYFWRHLYVP